LFYTNKCIEKIRRRWNEPFRVHTHLRHLAEPDAFKILWTMTMPIETKIKAIASMRKKPLAVRRETASGSN
jgi:hypothetical protein